MSTYNITINTTKEARLRLLRRARNIQETIKITRKKIVQESTKIHKAQEELDKITEELSKL